MKKDRKRMLAEESIFPLLMKLSTPAMVGMLVMALYNLVDTIFIGRGVGSLGIAGVSIVFPLQLLAMAFAQIFGVGGGSVISRALGEGNFEKAENILKNVFVSSIITGFILTLVGYVFGREILYLFGAEEDIIGYSYEYLFNILPGVVFITFAMSGNNTIRSEGNAKVAMLTMLVSAILNSILDPIFIFYLNWGIKGAAYATVLAQVMSAVVVFYYYFTGKSEIKINNYNFVPQWKYIREILSIGMSAFARQAAGSVMAMILNRSLQFYGGSIAIAAFGVLNRLSMVAFMPIFGIVQGMQPVTGYNYGAKNYDRVIKTIYVSVAITTVLCFISMAIIRYFPEALISIFNKDKDLMKVALDAIEIVTITMPLIGTQMIAAGLYQALGKAIPAFILSMTRQILFFIPLVLILPKYFNLAGVWASFPGAEILAFLLCAVYIFIAIKDLRRCHEG